LAVDWDLGLQLSTIRTNSGTSGPGQAGAIDMGEVDFASITEAPVSGYTADETGTVYTGMPPTADKTFRCGVNNVLDAWIIVDTSNPPPKYTISNKIFVVKTADGKYAKVWFKDYFDDRANSGHVTFDYVYNADGGRTLE
jgi:hypothetical protein